MQKILFTALVAGFIAGVAIFLMQNFKLTPLILQAENYEQASSEHSESKTEHEHHHDENAWQPTSTLERSSFTLLADIGMGVAFALILIGSFTLFDNNVKNMDAKIGALWGLAGFAVFSLAPSFGLPPELPTTMAADLADRQIWWVATVMATAIALLLIVFGKSNLLRATGVFILALPHIIGAPIAPLGGAVPTELNAQFAASSITSMAIFWIVLGVTSGWFYGRYNSLKNDAIDL